MTDSSMNSSSTGDDYVDRDQESEEISSQFRSHLDRRGQRSNFSPSYLESRPKSALEKHHITVEQEEQILYLYAATYSLHQTAASAGIPLDKVRAVVYSPQLQNRITEYREAMKISVLQKIEEAQVVLLDAVQDPDKLKNASITQISEVFVEISETQANLITTLRESYNPTTDMDPGELFSGEELEYMMLLRRRLDIGPSAIPEEVNLDAPLDPIETEFVDLSPSGDSLDIEAGKILTQIRDEDSDSYSEGDGE